MFSELQALTWASFWKSLWDVFTELKYEITVPTCCPADFLFLPSFLPSFIPSLLPSFRVFICFLCSVPLFFIPLLSSVFNPLHFSSIYSFLITTPMTGPSFFSPKSSPFSVLLILQGRHVLSLGDIGTAKPENILHVLYQEANIDYIWLKYNYI